MDSISKETIQILFFLMPGLLASIFVESLIVRKGRDQFTLIVEALIFSVFIYITYQLINGKKIINFLENYDYMCITQYLELVGISIFYGILFGVLIYRDAFHWFFRTIKITKKTSRMSIWNDIMETNLGKKNWANIHMSNGQIIIGQIYGYSDSPDSQYIFVENPYLKKNEEEILSHPYYNPILLKKGKKKLIDGILITPEMKIDYIEFFKDETIKN